MFKSAFVFALCLSAALAAPPTSRATPMLEIFNHRIIGGTPAERGQFPWQAALNFRTPSGSFFCGGSLINENWVLTAAHCTVDTLSITVRLGKTQLNSVESGEVEVGGTGITHENYNPFTLNNDIGLVRLDSPVQFSEWIQPVPLPSAGSVVGVGESLTVSGHGLTQDGGSVSNTLYYVELQSMANSECADYYGSSVVVSSTLCLKTDPGHSTCSGDSGGPLVSYASGEAVHVGAVSFGSSQGCEYGAPVGFARTESFLSWINGKIN